MVLNNHLYSLYYQKRKHIILEHIFDKFDIPKHNFQTQNETINIFEHSFLTLFPENYNLIHNLIQCLDSDNLDIEFLTFRIMRIFFDHNELDIKNLPSVFNIFIDNSIFLEIIMHIHILLLNMYFFDDKLLSKIIKINLNDDTDSHSKGNNYLMLIKIMMKTSHIFQKTFINCELVTEKEILEYVETNKKHITELLNFNLDTTIEKLFKIIDHGDEVDKNNKNILKLTLINMFNEFQKNIEDFIKIFINILDKKGISIPEEEKKNIFILITTVFNYNIVKIES
jgi:hypothetical protein